MTDLATLTDETLNLLYGAGITERPDEDTITSSPAAGDPTITFATDAMWKRGDYAEFDDGEIVILAADASGATAVRRAQRGSTAAGHTSGARVVRNPLFPIVDVQRRIQTVIRTELWPHVWSWHQGSVTWVTGDHIYDLPQYIEEVDLVYQVSLDGFRWQPISTGDWEVERQIDTTVATNSNMLRLRSIHFESQDVLYIGRRRPHVDDLANLSDEIAAIIPFGAAATAIAARPSPLQVDASRNKRAGERDMVRTYQLLRSEFETKRDQLRRQLLNEVKRERRFVPRSRRTW